MTSHTLPKVSEELETLYAERRALLQKLDVINLEILNAGKKKIFLPEGGFDWLDELCTVFSVHKEDLFKRNQKDRIVQPRQCAFFIACKALGWTLVETGRFFQINHTSVHYGIKTFENELSVHRGTRMKLIFISEHIQNPKIKAFIRNLQLDVNK